MPEAARVPRTQQQRRDGTRRALLDAAVESLIEVGFARTTTLEVQRRAREHDGTEADGDVTPAELRGLAPRDTSGGHGARRLAACAEQEQSD